VNTLIHIQGSAMLPDDRLVGQLGWAVDDAYLAVARLYLIGNAWGGDQEIQVVSRSSRSWTIPCGTGPEAGAEAKPQRLAGFRLVNQRGVVQLQLLQSVLSRL
jgi:hypothetical protein